MSFLMIRCPQSGREVLTGIETDCQSFEKMTDVIAYTRCPHCGIEHGWWPDEAWLTESRAVDRGAIAVLKPEPMGTN